MDIKSRIEQNEYKFLSEFAQKSAETRGREHPIKPDSIRSEYQRDRDRILHSKSFRCLKHKTQVFLSPNGDYFRTRLTHTLEVSQISRTISRSLCLNVDLTEAISLGHDLGHTPFGHAGERALKACDGKFEHNVQSLRIVDNLENGTGLNLTFEVRDGILNHKKDMKPATLEGMVVNFSDRIAYINHDIDDAILAGVISLSDIPKDLLDTLGHTHGECINNMIVDIIKNSEGKDCICMSDEISEATDALRDFMFENVYYSQFVRGEEPKIINGIKMLFDYYMNDRDEFYRHNRASIEKYGSQQTVIDYIAGMSDRYAINLFNKTFVPQVWL